MVGRVALIASFALPLPLGAQIHASEVGTMSQVMDGTKLAIEYSRPRARGRDSLFGTKYVEWGETWTPGANWATTLETDRDIKLNGRAVPKGKYSVWMVVRKTRDWTFVLDPQWHRYHLYPPDSSGKQIRLPVRAESAPFTDVLTFSMPELHIDGGTLVFQWERVRVPIKVDVQPSLVMSFPADEAKQYVGKYEYAEHDTTGKLLKVMTFTITHEDGTLKGQWTPDDPYFKKFALIRIAPDVFTVGVYDKNGQIYEVLKPDITAEFTRVNGRVAAFTMRDGADNLVGKATRKP